MREGRVYGIVLAGGKAWSGQLKATVKVGGETLLGRMVQALRGVPHLDRLLVVAPEEVFWEVPEGIPCLPDRGSLWANTFTAIHSLQPGPDDYLLLCPADLPFVTPLSLQAFLTHALETGADLVYLAVPLEAVQRFVGQKKVSRTSLTLREGTLTGGNLFLMRFRAFPKIARFAGEAIKRRKNPLWLGQLAGWGLILRFLLGKLSVGEIEMRAEEILGCRCKALIADLPELAFDVDKPDDLALAERVMKA